MIECKDGPLAGTFVDPKLGESWPAATVGGPRDFLIGYYRLDSEPCCGQCETRHLVYKWDYSSLEQIHCE